MPVTIKDIAEKTGYTVATVSRALNDSPMVHKKTKEKIFSVAKEMGYTKYNKYTAIPRNPYIGVIIPDITNPYFPLLVKGIQDSLQKEGYSIVLCNSNGIIENEKRYGEMLCDLHVQGIIMDPLCDDSYNFLVSSGLTIPVVFTGNRPLGEKINYISIDNYNGATKATKYLIGLGHKKIAYIGGNEDTFTNRERFRGYRDIIIEFFGELDDSIIKYNYPDRQHGFDSAAEIIQQGNIPTAVIASNDSIALGVIECFMVNGFNIPNDVSIIGFDNIEFSSLPGISLTTVNEPRYDIGVMAAESIIKLINGSMTPPIQIDIEPELIMRKTCTKVKY